MIYDIPAGKNRRPHACGRSEYYKYKKYKLSHSTVSNLNLEPPFSDF
jgi:hypothetical protein